jgi:lysyl-tRNA synthetase class 2
MNPSGPVLPGGGEEGILAARRGRAEAVRARGANPFTNDIDVSDRVLVRDLRERFQTALQEPASEERYDAALVASIAARGDTSVHVLGRLVARRGFGKASFLRVRDLSGEIQIFAKQDILGQGFAALEDIDVGDHVEVRGGIMVTKTGELSVQASSIRLVTKAVRPPPDKWHGLTDVEARYRQRYVDFVATPDAAVVVRARALLVQGLRQFLDARGFVEVETPTLHSIVGGAAAKPFSTHHNALDLDLFLRIAPELYLKRLLVGGFERVYEIGRCYRNEGISTRHNPEFTMLEFYEAYATYETLLPLTEQLFRAVDGHLGEKLREMGLGAFFEARVADRPFTLAEPFARVPMQQAVLGSIERAGLPAALIERLADLPSADALVTELRRKSERAARIDWANLRRSIGKCEHPGDRLFIAYEYFAEPFLSEDYRSADGTKSVPVFILDYPAEISPLARRKDENPSLVDRFELFVEGRELCNAFSELNDPDDQAARFRDQVARKARGEDETMDYDEDYIRALEQGMPPAAGFGLGVDRLAMTLLGQPSIRDVIAFPLLRPETVST